MRNAIANKEVLIMIRSTCKKGAMPDQIMNLYLCNALMNQNYFDNFVMNVWE